MVEQVPASLIAETEVYCAELERVLADAPAVHTVPPEETRRARREGHGIWPPPVFLPDAEMFEIDGPAGPLRLRIIAPAAGRLGAFLHIHGGGWTLGDCDLQDLRLQRLSAETGLAVVSVGYRLAPEDPYPAACEDCEVAAIWLTEHAERLRLPPGAPLAIGGDSAGGHLTAITLLRLRDRHGLTPFSAAVLQYGAFDLSMTPSQRRWGERNLVLSTPIIEWFEDQFLPGCGPEQRRDPEISPLYASLDGLPPATFTVGTADPLLDDTLFMCARWRSAGQAADLRIWPAAPHGFVGLPMSIADLALDAEHAFLRRTLGLEPARA